MFSQVKNGASTKVFRKLQNRLFVSLAFVVFLAFVYLTLWGENGLIRLVKLYHLKDRAIANNNAILRQSLSYLEEIRRLKQPHFIEQTTRNELGFVRPNEMVFVVDEN